MIPVFKPAIGSDTVKAAVDALDLGWLGMGSYVREFEAALSTYFELPPERRLVAVNTCTSALHLALECAGVGPGDEVITPALNNIGDLQAIGMCGAKPVFVDIREQDLGIDVDQLESLIGPRTKAIIALHYMGIPCDIAGVFDVAQRHGLRVIEDAAHATGTRWQGKRVGSYGDLTCFSFDAIKTLTCIDGGAVVTPSAEEAERLYPARLLGMTQSNERLYSNNRAYQYDVYSQGYRYHLANLHAAVGLSQLKRLPEFIANRRRYCRQYNAMLADVPGIVIPQSDFADASVFHYVIRVLNGRREDLAAHLTQNGIDTGIHWVPGNRFTRFCDCRGADALPVTDRVGNEILTLPLWSYMEDTVIAQVANSIRAFCKAPAVTTKADLLQGRELVRFAKTHRFTIPVADAPGVRLRAVMPEQPDEHDVQRLTDWRNRNVRSFLTEFEATPDRTRRWLTQSVAGDDSRILWMIEGPQNETIGYIGLAAIDWPSGSAEADSVVRGLEGHPGVMTRALQSLIQWAQSELGMLNINVRVLGDNPACAFYEKFGFRETRRVPLRRAIHGDCVAWEPCSESTADFGSHEPRCLVHMELLSERQLSSSPTIETLCKDAA